MFGSLFNRPRSHIFVACFPKSGSTYLCKALEALTSFQAGFVAEHGKHNDQDISARRLRRLKSSSVIQQHAKGTCNNVRLLAERRLRPIVHVRNIFDVVVSLYDHLKREDDRVPTGYVHREYWTSSHAEQLDYLIQVHLPWYFNFLVSWHEASEKLPVFVSTYERLMADRTLLLQEIAGFYSLSVSDEQISRAIESADGQSTRRNRAIVGRGQTELSARHQEAIWRLARVWQISPALWDRVGLAAATAAA